MSRPATFVPPPGARAYRLVTARGEFAVIEAGSRRAAQGTALLLPGFTGSKEDFISLHEPLAAAGYRTVAVDGRGQYESPGPTDDEAPYAQAELARDVLAQVDALAADPSGTPRSTALGAVHLVGHSSAGRSPGPPYCWTRPVSPRSPSCPRAPPRSPPPSSSASSCCGTRSP